MVVWGSRNMRHKARWKGHVFTHHPKHEDRPTETNTGSSDFFPLVPFWRVAPRNGRVSQSKIQSPWTHCFHQKNIVVSWETSSSIKYLFFCWYQTYDVLVYQLLDCFFSTGLRFTRASRCGIFWHFVWIVCLVGFLLMEKNWHPRISRMKH